jgi:Fe-S-cluster containining protein
MDDSVNCTATYTTRGLPCKPGNSRPLDLMSNDGENQSEQVRATAQLSISGHRFEMEMSVPKAPMRPGRLLPLLQSMADTVVGIAEGSAREEGLTISCKKGCGACCRQLVPISTVEARRLRDLIREMPEPRRSRIRVRFEAARRRLHESGMLEGLLHPERMPEEQAQALGLQYFYQGIACPFLEEESCSIHPDRPIACREYLVTSPAENCARPTAETVDCVKIPVQISRVVRRLDEHSNPHPAHWVPLVLAPAWAEANPDIAPLRSGIELVREVFSRLTGEEIEGVKAEAGACAE